MALLKKMLTMFTRGGHQTKMSPRNVVLITGCDSGLGYSFALLCHSLEMTVISACHNIESDGARQLRSLSDSGRIHTIEFDLLRYETIAKLRTYVVELLNAGPQLVFTALVNNAGVMCFGEFEWQTRSQLEMQINVNVLGTMALTKEMLPLIRRHHARIINITSHCGLQALPSLAPYAASKAALRFWNDSLRIEMQQYDVSVINFIPGSLVTDTNIAARQQTFAQAMLEEFNDEQRQFYGDYFRRFNDYLKVVSGFKPPNKVRDAEMLSKFKDALTNTQPRTIYIHEPMRYKLYRLLISLCPTFIADWLKVKFCAMPTYQQVAEPAVVDSSQIRK